MGKIVQNYNLIAVLGEGVYGKVHKAIHMLTNQEVAVKVIKASKFKEIPKLEECTINEINTLTSMEPNKHIVRYLDMLKTVNNYYFVYEFCNGGTLEVMIQNYKKNTPEKAMPLRNALNFFMQMLEAFRTLTKHSIMHRDLKPENILLHNGQIKIADFGFCKSLRNPTDIAQTMLGSPMYMAPEVIRGEAYTMKADIWSLGVVLFEMVFGYCPYQESSIAKLILALDKEELSFPKHTSHALEKLLRRMLTKEAAKRIDWTQIFQYRVTENGELIEPQMQRTSKYVHSQGPGSPTTVVQDSSYNNKSSTATTSSSTDSFGYSTSSIPKTPTQNLRDTSTSTNNKRISTVNTIGNRLNSVNNPSAPVSNRLLFTDSPQNSGIAPHMANTTYKKNNSSKTNLPINSMGNIIISDAPEAKITYAELVKRHLSVANVTRLATAVSMLSVPQASILAYILMRTVKDLLLDLAFRCQKQQSLTGGVVSNNNLEMVNIQNFKSMIYAETKDLHDVIWSFEQTFQKLQMGTHKSIIAKKNYYLRRVVESSGCLFDDRNRSAQQTQDTLILMGHLVDYLGESINPSQSTIRGNASREELRIYLNNKLMKLDNQAI